MVDPCSADILNEQNRFDLGCEGYDIMMITTAVELLTMKKRKVRSQPAKLSKLTDLKLCFTFLQRWALKYLRLFFNDIDIKMFQRYIMTIFL